MTYTCVYKNPQKLSRGSDALLAICTKVLEISILLYVRSNTVGHPGAMTRLDCNHPFDLYARLAPNQQSVK